MESVLGRIQHFSECLSRVTKERAHRIECQRIQAISNRWRIEIRARLPSFLVFLSFALLFLLIFAKYVFSGKLSNSFCFFQGTSNTPVKIFLGKKNQHTLPQSIRQLVSKFPYYRQELRIWGSEGGGQGFPY